MHRRAFLFGVAAAAAAAPEDGFIALFDGKSLSGWRNPYPDLKAWVEKGELCLLSRKAVWLVHERAFGDFVLDSEVRVPDGGNSGVQFRSHMDGQRVVGYQAEIDTSTRRWAGGLYDQGRRTWLGPLEGKPEAQAAYRNNAWNRVRVECIADRIRIWMNGAATVDYIDPVDIEGHVALQHHGDFQGHPAETYRFRNLRLKPLGKHEWTPAEGAGLVWKAAGGWDRRGGRVVWRTPGKATVDASGKPGLLQDFTLRFFAKPIYGEPRLVLRHSSGDVWLAAAPDERFGRLWRPGFDPLSGPAAALQKQFFAPALWNSVVLSSRAGRFAVHVNGIRTAEWSPPRDARLEALHWESPGESHLELRDFELLKSSPGN